MGKSIPLFYLFLFAAASVSSVGGQTPNPSTAVLVIEGGTLIDGTGRPPAPGTTILIEGNRIREIGKQGEITTPGNAHIIQASGKFIIPGLIDAHVHYRYPWIHRLYLANGVTTVRDMGSQVERVLTLRQELAVGNILGPRMFVSGIAINPGSVKAMGVSTPRELAQKLVEAGVDGIKVTGYTQAELEEVVEVAHAHGLLVYGHTGPRLMVGPPERFWPSRRDWTTSNMDMEFWKIRWEKRSRFLLTLTPRFGTTCFATGMVACIETSIATKLRL